MEALPSTQHVRLRNVHRAQPVMSLRPARIQSDRFRRVMLCPSRVVQFQAENTAVTVDRAAQAGAGLRLDRARPQPLRAFVFFLRVSLVSLIEERLRGLVLASLRIRLLLIHSLLSPNQVRKAAGRTTAGRLGIFVK